MNLSYDPDLHDQLVSEIFKDASTQDLNDLERAAIANSSARAKHKNSKTLWANALRLEKDGGRRLWEMWYLWSHPKFGSPGGGP